MDGTPANQNESATSSLMELLKNYKTRRDERETLLNESTRAHQTPQKTQLDENVNKSHSSNSDHEQEKSTINYKAKWEESEAKYRQLESGTIKQLQDKINQLQRENNQMKIIKERISEIFSCRQLTNVQFEQLKSLVNNDNVSIETIANKNDFLQQTRKLRDILLKHNDELFNKIDEMIKKKRKRSQYEDDLSDQDEEDERNR